MHLSLCIVNCALCILFSLSTSAQTPFVYWDSIPVVQWGDSIKYPFAGGFNNPQFSTIDLNGDGIEDLFVFERSTNKVYPFLNKGTAGLPDYVYAPQYRKCFPPGLYGWVLLRDYNCDGKKDIFTGMNSSFAVYRNDYDSTGLKFTFMKAFDASFCYIFNNDIPAISDLDNDGDLDILTFDGVGLFMQYFKNISIDSFHTCDSLTYVHAEQCWGSFEEAFGDCYIKLGSDSNNSCVLHYRLSSNDTLSMQDESGHPGNTVLALDLNGDSIKDLIIGPLVCTDVLVLLDSTASDIAVDSAVTQIDPYPIDNPIQFAGRFAATFYEDLNNDGKKDLIAAPNLSYSEDTVSVWYYKDTSSTTIPKFSFQQKDLLQHDMIDVGTGSYPVFFDYNGDSLIDLVIGNYFYFLPGTPTGGPSQLALYKNTGTKQSPAFTLITRDFASLSQFNFHGIYPAFGDLRGTGVKDMIIGESTGRLLYFVNTAGKGQPANFEWNGLDFDSINGQFAAPQLVDVNCDGKLDLLVGQRNGTIEYFENTGTVTSPKFSKTPTNDKFGNVDVASGLTGYAIPFLTSDEAGNFQLLVGTQSGAIYLYTPVNNDLNSSFQLVDSAYSGISEGMGVYISQGASICGADIDNDGKMDLVVGNYAGGITLFKGQLKRAAPNCIVTPPLQPFSVSVYPNPVMSNNPLTVHITGLTAKDNADIYIYDVLGQTIFHNQLPAVYNDWSINIPSATFSAGVYFLRVIIPSGVDAGTNTVKFIMGN